MTDPTSTSGSAFARILRERPPLYISDAAPSGSIKLPLLPPGKFIGREHDLDAVLDIITARSSRLLTILGPGGVGKTRLAITAAWHTAHQFRDGAFFIQFGSTPPADLGAFIGQHLGVTNPEGERWTDVLGDYIRQRELLLVMDNCEYVIDDLVRHIPILVTSPDLMVVATSQQAFQIEYEREYWLQPLGLPAGNGDPSLESLQESSAVDLFVSRARRINPDFELTNENAAHIAAIVRMLDGLPLALELATAQLRHLTPYTLRTRLENALSSLAGDMRAIPERQRSLVNITTWSLSLLSEEDQQLFLRLTVLDGNFTPQAAATVMGLPLSEAWEKLMLFADKSLIKRQVGEDSTPLFFMLQTVHATAGQMLESRPQLHREAMRLHGTYFLELGLEFQEHAHGPRMTAWLDQLDLELGGIQTFITRAQDDDLLRPIAIQLFGPMFWYWYSRNHHAWALKRIENLLDGAGDEINPRHIGAAHIAAGWLAFKQTQIERAAWHFRRGLDLIPDRSSPVALRGQIGLAFTVAAEGDNREEATRILEEEIRLAQERPDAWHELGAGHFGIAQLDYYHGDYDGVRSRLETTLRLSHAHGDDQSAGMVLLFMAQIDRKQGNLTSAIHLLQEALPSYIATNDLTNLASLIDFIAATLLDLGAEELAARVGVAGEKLRKDLNIPRTPLDIRDHRETLDRLRTLAHEMGLINGNVARISLDRVLNEFLTFEPEQVARSSEPETPRVEELLSERELEILRLISRGKTMKQAADEIFISPHTVKRHMANIRRKLGVRSQAAAVAALQQSR